MPSAVVGGVVLAPEDDLVSTVRVPVAEPITQEVVAFTRVADQRERRPCSRRGSKKVSRVSGSSTAVGVASSDVDLKHPPVDGGPALGAVDWKCYEPV